MYNGNYYGYNPQNPYSYGAMPDNLSQLRGQTIPQSVPQAASQPQNNSGLIWVQGETGAKSFLVAPNTTIMLMDSEKDVFYLKSADGSGMPLPLRVFEYTERTSGENGTKTPQEQPTESKGNYATIDDINVLQSEIEALTARIEALSGKQTKTGKEAAKNE